MKAIALQPNLVEQVKNALLEEITSGKLNPGERIIQEQIAQALGVSRQPVQQALLLLKNQGVLKEASGRGLVVAPLDADHVEDIYEMRAAIEGMACRLAATLRADHARKQGESIIVPRMIAADIKFHEFLYSLSGNPLIGPAMNTHLTYTQRVMGEVLIQDQEPWDIWAQHDNILKAIASGDADLAEKLAIEHLTHASTFMVARLKAIKAE
jgi:DNA-binding GntR family transcriptional regulator